MDLFNDTEEVPPSEILVTLGGVLRNLPAGITFPPEVSEVSIVRYEIYRYTVFHCAISFFQQLFSSVSDLIDTVQQMDNNGVSQ